MAEYRVKARSDFSNTPGNVPADPFEDGQLRIQQADGKLFTKKPDGSTRTADIRDMPEQLASGPLADAFGAKAGLQDIVVSLGVTRSEIGTLTVPLRAFRVSGEHAPGDFGEGAVYVLGTSTGLRAIRDASNRWFNLAVGDVLNAGHLGCRPVFLRSGCTIAAGSNQLVVNSGAEWRVGETVMISGAGASPTTFQKTFQVNGPPARSGSIFFGADGFIFNANSSDGGVTFLTTDTAAQCAAAIRAGSWPGWTVTGSGTTAIFTRNKPGGTIGVRFSDIFANALPITETLNQEGTGDLVATITAINGNTLTLSANAVTAVSGGLCYLEHGTQLRAFQDAIPGKSIQFQAGFYTLLRGLKFRKEGTGPLGAGLNNTVFYAFTAGEPVIEFELASAATAYFAPMMRDFLLDMMEARREGVTSRRLWDGTSMHDVKIDNVGASWIGFAVRRHSTQPPSASVNDQTVVSQSVTLSNIHVERASNSNSAFRIPVAYFEYVQEGALTNFKAIIRGDTNTWQDTTAVQWEACRGLVAGPATSFGGAATGLQVSSLTGQSEGCAAIGATFETNQQSLWLSGGTYDILDFNVLAPRVIGGGGAFQIDRLNGGLIDAVDRVLNLTTAATKVQYLTKDPVKVTDALLSNGNVDLAKYRVGFATTFPVDLIMRRSLGSFLFRNNAGSAFYRLLLNASDDVNLGFYIQSSGDGVTWTTVIAVNPDGSVDLNIPSVGLRKIVAGAVDSATAGFRQLRIAN